MKLLLLLTLILPAIVSGGFPTGSVQVSTPQRMNLSLGYCFSGASMLGPSSGLLVRVEPGISGGKFHLGLRSLFGMLSIPVASVDVTGSLMRTWNDPWGGVEGGQTYAGGEVRLGLRVLVFTAGYYEHLAGDGDDRGIWSLGAGIGL